MFLLEILFDLFTAIPFWLLLVFIFCIAKFLCNNKHRKIYKRWCVVLGIVNFFLIGVHYTAIFGSGPLRGIVIDKVSGRPLAGVEVQARWRSLTLAPVQIPTWAVVVHKITTLKCSVSSHTMVTDAEGKFSSSSWYGAKVWHGCSSGFFGATAENHRLLYEDDSSPRKVSIFSPARIVLDRKPKW